jgi:hypothetical protein
MPQILLDSQLDGFNELSIDSQLREGHAKG